MEYIYIGRISDTHGLKGELKIKSNFKYKNQIFKKDFIFYIGKDKQKQTILSYRPHQEYDMVILNNINDIDTALKHKGQLVFVDKKDLNIKDNEYLDEDLINCICYFNKKEIGKITNIIDAGNKNELLVLNQKTYIPKNDNFIEKIDIKSKTLYLKNVEGLI